MGTKKRDPEKIRINQSADFFYRPGLWGRIVLGNVQYV